MASHKTLQNAEGVWERSDLYKEVIEYFFTKRCLHFLTIQPYPKGKKFAKWQKIGPISDHLRKCCKTFFVVREFCKDGKSHYHALVSGYDPGKICRHASVHEQPVNPTVKVRIVPEGEPYNPTVSEKIEKQHRRVMDELKQDVPHPALRECTAVYLIAIWNQQRKALERHNSNVRRTRHQQHVERVTNYMMKTFINPIEWSDYIFKREKVPD